MTVILVSCVCLNDGCLWRLISLLLLRCLWRPISFFASTVMSVVSHHFASTVMSEVSHHFASTVMSEVSHHFASTGMSVVLIMYLWWDGLGDCSAHYVHLRLHNRRPWLWSLGILIIVVARQLCVLFVAFYLSGFSNTDLHPFCGFAISGKIFTITVKLKKFWNTVESVFTAQLYFSTHDRLTMTWLLVANFGLLQFFKMLCSLSANLQTYLN